MKTRQLGISDLHISEIGLGAWAIGGGGYAFGWGEQDDHDSIKTIQHAFEVGVNWVDTAAIYGLGHSERVVGEAIRGRRDEVIVATKCSMIWDDNGNISSSLKAESVRAECEASLKRLGVDYIDLYQIHWPSDEERIEEGWAEIGRLIEEGKVRYGGVSNFLDTHLERAQTIHPVTSLQPPYSMMRRWIEDAEMPWCAANDCGIVCYSPMQAGLLTDNFSEKKLDDEDWRHQSKEHVEPNVTINLMFVDQLRPIAASYDMGVAQLALAWTLRRSEVTSAIAGARRPSQIEQTATASGWSISEVDLNTIDGLLVDRERRVKEIGGYILEVKR
jgi:aryl-alcohol dehydrogenase-like predicted oxidoreductase